VYHSGYPREGLSYCGRASRSPQSPNAMEPAVAKANVIQIANPEKLVYQVGPEGRRSGGRHGCREVARVSFAEVVRGRESDLF
jgi:hypothetical protein